MARLRVIFVYRDCLIGYSFVYYDNPYLYLMKPVFMKRAYIALFTTLTLVACKERGNTIEFANKVVEDSTYVASVEPVQKHNILVEEFTGAQCVNCPAAALQLHELSSANDDRLIVIGMHLFGYGPAEPAPGHKYDLRTEESGKLKDIYFGDFAGAPAAGFDRLKLDGKYANDTRHWNKGVEEGLVKKAPVNIEITSKYDQAGNKANIQVKLSYTTDLTGKHKLSIALVEDSIVDVQEIPGAANAFDSNYVFMHTLRDYVTALNGDAFLDDLANKEAGRVFIRRFNNVEINPDWVAKHCRLIAFVHYNDGDNREVLQAAEANLVQ